MNKYMKRAKSRARSTAARGGALATRAVRCRYPYLDCNFDEAHDLKLEELSN